MTMARAGKCKTQKNTWNGAKIMGVGMDAKEGLRKLRAPFEAHQINLLPRPYKKDSPKGHCNECGGYHGLPAIHLKYIGHAALTDRLLDCDESWTWEPLALGSDGLPLLDKDGGMWIKLTVCGVTRFGYGDAQGKIGPDAMKERIGDALRNAAMRFGAALDLWHKGDLHKDDEDIMSDSEMEDLRIAMREAEELEALERIGKGVPGNATTEQKAELAGEYTKRKRALAAAKSKEAA